MTQFNKNFAPFYSSNGALCTIITLYRPDITTPDGKAVTPHRPAKAKAGYARLTNATRTKACAARRFSNNRVHRAKRGVPGCGMMRVKACAARRFSSNRAHRAKRGVPGPPIH